MNIASALKDFTQRLEQAGIETARLDTLILLEEITGHDRAWLLANPQSEISEAKIAQLRKLFDRRAQHEPLAYIRGKAEFYGRKFAVSHDVLVPRPETETMIDLLKQLIVDEALGYQSLAIADVGAGSGALGLTTALEVPNSHVELLEIDTAAARVAKTNVDKFTLGINVIESDLLNETSSNYDILLCNLPYVPDDYEINQAAKHEPAIALYGGSDGLSLYRRLFQEASSNQFVPLYILSESLPSQHTVLAQIATKNGYSQLESHDFIQVFKYQKSGKN